MVFFERYRETLLFGRPDRVPFMPGCPRESTLKAWHRQGLPEGTDWYTALCGEIGLPPMQSGPASLDVSLRMNPAFEEKVLEHKDGHYIVQDWMGAITEISDEFDYTYIRAAKDFVTRKWHKFPVASRADWEMMRERYQAGDPDRFPAGWIDRCHAWQKSGLPISLQVNGPFWQLREWCGFENLCMLFLDDPDFVQEMIGFWTEFVSMMLARTLAHVKLDRLGISEDMAYKAHSMISPAMTRRFLQPAYCRWVEEVKAAGCMLVDMDSDGYIGELIPIWIEAGINVCDPVEVAAHNDLAAFRAEFGRRMAYIGGVDKRALAAGGEVMEAEIERLAPVIRDGGYIPGCDHGVPPDISWPHFVAYGRVLARACGWFS